MADIKIQLYKKTGSDFESVLLQNADWYGIPNKPSTYTPTAHTHTISNITNLQSTLNSKQATLVSGTNIKTINGNSLLGSGNITIDGGSGGGLKFVGTLNINIGESGGGGWLVDSIVNYQGVMQQKGSYFIAIDDGVEIYSTDESGFTMSLGYTFDDGMPITVQSIVLEKGDWLIINDLDLTATPKKKVSFAIINNTYPGVVALKQEVEDAFDELATLMEGV